MCDEVLMAVSRFDKVTAVRGGFYTQKALAVVVLSQNVHCFVNVNKIEL